jgi:pinoresinol/lariciresinol reductase
MDPSRMAHAIEPGNLTFIAKMEVRRAIEQACIPFTYISANCYAVTFVANLCQLEKLFPSRESVCLYGDGNVKGKTVCNFGYYLFEFDGYFSKFCCKKN